MRVPPARRARPVWRVISHTRGCTLHVVCGSYRRMSGDRRPDTAAMSAADAAALSAVADHWPRTSTRSFCLRPNPSLCCARASVAGQVKSVRVAGAVGLYASNINGVYRANGYTLNGHATLRMVHDHDRWLV